MVTVEPAALISIAPPQLGQLSALTAAAGAPAAGSSMGRHPPAFDRPQVGRRELGERHIPAVIEMGALLIALQAGAATARRSEVDARDRPAGDRGEGQLALGGDVARSAHVGCDQSLVADRKSTRLNS